MLPLTLLFIFVFLFLFIHITINALKRARAKQNLPPGPWKLPIIGNLHQLSSSSVHVSLRDLAKRYGPIMLVQLGEIPTVVVSSKEMAEHVLHTEGIKFAERPIFDAFKSTASDNVDSLSFFAPYGASWRETRKIYTMELLSKNRVQSFKNARENAIRDFLNSISPSSGKPINFSKQIFRMIYSLNYMIIFGKKIEHLDALISMFTEQVALAAQLVATDVFPSFRFLTDLWTRRMKSAYSDLDRQNLIIFDALVRDRKAERKAMKIRSKSSGEGLLIDALLQIQESENEKVPMKDSQIMGHIREVFAAGSETTSSTLDWVISELIRNPRVMAKAQAEVRHHLKGKKEVDEADVEQLKYLKLIIKETMRLHPSSPLLSRICRENCEINGYKIPQKTHILVNIWALGRDPNYWINPEEFKPERFEDSSISFTGMNFEFIPFGAGRRMCPGITYAMANIEVLLAQLLYHFDWKLANEAKVEELDMTDVNYGTSSKRKKDLYLIAFPSQLD